MSLQTHHFIVLINFASFLQYLPLSEATVRFQTRFSPLCSSAIPKNCLGYSALPYSRSPDKPVGFCNFFLELQPIISSSLSPLLHFSKFSSHAAEGRNAFQTDFIYYGLRFLTNFSFRKLIKFFTFSDSVRRHSQHTVSTSHRNTSITYFLNIFIAKI